MLNHLQQYSVSCEHSELKYFAMQQIYGHLTIGQAVIFCRTKANVRELNIRMSIEGHSVRELTEALDIEQCTSVMKAFKEGLFRVLISTNTIPKGRFDSSRLVDRVPFSFRLR